MDRADILKDMRDRMGYKDQPDNICATCARSMRKPKEEILCVLSPVYNFPTQPGATCSFHLHDSRILDLNNLNK